MQRSIIFAIIATAVITVGAIPVQESKVNGVNGWYVPNLNGTFEWIFETELDILTKEQQNFEERLDSTPVNFYLYTKSNPVNAQEITNNFKSITNSNFNAKNPTRVVIHGWTQGLQSSMNADIRDAWLSKGDYNIIIVDWGRARFEYATAVLAIPASAAKISNLLDYLHQNHGMSLDTVEVIGHSLGAHVAGYTGKNMKSGHIHAIIALDPAMPLFSYDKPDQRLNENDASYVESIQTCGGELGFLKPIGKSSFYPNGGKSQPGCGLDVSGACAHARSITYYAEAVRKNDFPSMKCSTYENAVKKNCGNTYSTVRMAAPTNTYSAVGSFYVPVNSKAPYGMSG